MLMQGRVRSQQVAMKSATQDVFIPIVKIQAS